MGKTYKLRQLTYSENNTYFGITIPKKIAQQFSGVSFMIEQCGNSIVMRSGCSGIDKLKTFEMII